MCVSDSPKRCLPLHWFTAVMAFIGVIMVLVAHGHYTVDVLIAYYVTTRLWYIYHTLANNNYLKVSLFLMNMKRMKPFNVLKWIIRNFFYFQQHGPNNFLARLWWFPLFKYFEKNIGGPVPRQYDWPLPWPRRFLTKHPNRDS